MRENKEMLLYPLIEKFTGHFTYGHEAGLDVDISVFLRQMKDIQVIKDFTMSFDRNTHHYKISIVHSEKVHFSNIHPIFLQFQGYIAFSSGGTLYAHKEISNGIRYILVLLWKEGEGYYCEIDFVGP